MRTDTARAFETTYREELALQLSKKYARCLPAIMHPTDLLDMLLLGLCLYLYCTVPADGVAIF